MRMIVAGPDRLARWIVRRTEALCEATGHRWCARLAVTPGIRWAYRRTDARVRARSTFTPGAE